ncbi:MAG: endonuclease/exonuclease/phosphatase family protein, partial [Kiritimatiellae bacterium]|nr:endonuclease/exonuclease/phosphatase family protein [Kiritimatiellia bacterium]
MKKTFGILILISIIVGADCANSKDARAENRIVVLTYNVHHGEGVDQQFDLERIAEVINSVSPDIVSLQEVDNKTTRSKGIDQAKELARLTNMTSVYGSSMDYAGGKYGNAVLTKLPIEGSKTIPLPGEPRSALCVTLTTSGKHSPAARFLFVATHLDAQPRFNYVALIEKLFDSDKDLPAILAGDLNAIPRSPTMQEFNKTWQNATSQKGLYTVPVNNPSKQIDYILCRPLERWRTVETKVINETVASDHRPILAVLELLPELKKKTKTISPNKPDADDSPAPQSSLSKHIADHVERGGKNDQLLLQDLPKFRQDLIQSIESGW